MSDEPTRQYGTWQIKQAGAQYQTVAAMIEISSSVLKPDHLIELGTWFVSEWGDAPALESFHNFLPCPAPLLATEHAAANSGLKALFVYSEFHRLYEKLGWQIQETSGGSKVLSKSLTSKQQQ